MKRDSHPLCSVDIFGVTYSSLLLKMHDTWFFCIICMLSSLLPISTSIIIPILFFLCIYQYSMLHLINYSLHNGAADNST